MTIYLLTVLVTIVLQALRTACGAEESGRPGRAPIQRCIDLACIVVLSAAPALRARQIGTDTWMYMEFYETRVDTSSWTNTAGRSLVEQGYVLWQFLLKSLGLDLRWFLAATASVTNGLQYAAIGMVAPRMLPAVSAYALSGLYLFQFNGMRQAMAMALFLYAAALTVRRRRGGPLFFLLAISIHTSAVIAVVAFLAARRSPERTTFRPGPVVLAGGGALAVLLMSSGAVSALTGLLGDKYGGYLGVDMGSGRGRLVHLVLMLLVVWFLQTTAVPAEQRRLSRFYSLGLGVQVVGLQLAVLDRVTLYFAAALPMLIGALVASGSRARHAALWAGIVTYYAVSLTRYGDLLPYAWSMP